MPDIKKIEKIDVLKAATQQTDNGVDIYSIITPAQDVLRISFVFTAGIKYQDKSYIATATANLLSEGTKNHTSLEIAEMLDLYGLYFDVSADREFVVITICSLGRFADKALHVLEEVLLYPNFSQKECDVYTQKRKVALQIEREKSNVIARETFAKAIFGEGHHYGTFSSAEDYDNVTVADLNAFYEKHYNAENLFVVLSGNISSETEVGVVDIISKLPSGVKHHIVSPTPTEEPVVLHVDAKDPEESVQSSVNIGRVMFNRNHPDFTAMQLTATLLGGYFSSRLMKNIREDKGYTYGIQSALINMQDSGYFIIGAQLQREFTDVAVEEIFKEIELLRTTPVPDEELEVVKRVMLGEILRVLDGPFGIADVAIENIQNGTDNSASELLVKGIRAITATQVQEMAQKYLSREDLTVVICN